MTHEDDDSALLGKGPCSRCGSSDANATYSDGHEWCFSCQTGAWPQDGEEGTDQPPTERKRMSADLIDKGVFRALTSRGITEETCRRYGYQVAKYRGQAVHVANYRDQGGNVFGQKLRFADKDEGMPWLGNGSKPPLFGQWLPPKTRRRVVVTEGEIDAMTISQATGNKWPVVSIPLGAGDAAKAFTRSLEWLSQFEQVVICFDMDEQGRKATQEAARVLPAGKAYICELPLKDANEMLLAGRTAELVDATFAAKLYRPDGIVSLADIREEAEKPIEWGLPWFLPTLTNLTYGRRWGDLYAIGAGTGIGKTDWFTEQMDYDVTQLGLKIGVFSLEQKPAETAKRLAGKVAGRRFHIPRACDKPDWDPAKHPDYVPEWTPQELTAALDKLDRDRNVFFFDSFGANEWDRVKDTMRFLYHAEGVRVFYLDHLTALAAAEEDERTGLERIMADMGGFVKEIPIIIHFISHLATPEGKPHEEGGRVSIRHFKGSRSIGFWSVFMFGLERDQQHEDPRLRSISTFRVLKDRYTGNATGEVIYLGYDKETGRLFETALPEEDGGFQDESGGDDTPF